MKARNIIIILICCCIFAVVASIIASSYPDGLEWVAEKLNFLGKGEGGEVIKSPMPDYTIPWIKNAFLSGGLAAIMGTAITFIVAFLIGKIITKPKIKDQKSK